MVSDNLLEYVRDEVERGVLLGDLRKALLDEGWHVDEVEHALRKVRGHKPRFSVKGLRGQIFLLVLLVLVSFATIFFVLNSSDSVRDCGSDEACFLDALSSCSPTTFEGLFVNEGKYLLEESYLLEVRGLTDDMCVVRFELLEVSYSYHNVSVDVSDQESLLRERIGLEAFCSIPLNMTDDFVFEGSFMLYREGFVCRGPFFSGSS